MMKKLPLATPALAAIAAVLALSSTPAIAQTIATPVAPPTASSVPADVIVTPLPSTPPPVFAAPVVQAPTIVLPPLEIGNERLVTSQVDAATVTPKAAATPKAVATSARRSAATQTQSVPAQSVAASPDTVPLATDPVTSVPVIGPLEPLSDANAPVAQATPIEPVSQSNVSSILLMAAGLAAALGVAAAAPLLMGRRKRVVPADHTVIDPITAMQDTPAARARAPYLAPVVPSQAALAPPPRPMAAHSMKDDLLSAFVAEAPSAENPFLTRKNRLRRARFILNQQAATREQSRQPVPASTTNEPFVAPAPVMAMRTVDRTQTVYDFGRSQPRRSWSKPATSQ